MTFDDSTRPPMPVRLPDPRPSTVYAYGTGGRPDGMAYAIGISYHGGPANGSAALVADRDHALIVGQALADSLGVPFHPLASLD